MTGKKRVERDSRGSGGLGSFPTSLPRIYDSAWLVREEKQSHLLT